MFMPMEIRNSIDTCSSRLKFYLFCENLCFWVQNAFFTISETNICEKSKILLKGCSMD